MTEQSGHREPPLVVVMGAAGSGKTVVGALLAERLDVPFIDGEDHQPTQNLSRIVEGVSLTDDDRQPWLQAVADDLRARRGGGVVIGCSALKAAHRDVLRNAAPEVFFLHLDVPRAVLANRLITRFAQCSPRTLLDDQMRALEPLRDDEIGTRVDGDQKIERVVRTALVAVTGGRASLPSRERAEADADDIR
ncbi:gluconokinase, GntK/IdnK-type [Microbacterium oryzae]|uniref:gluconokinase n=1 Tax=Microbacterium oryzae TaxID=743009 RepID=UPI0025B00FBB|nr:gluconokinase, GntK/IdnK-type [Microbacterium oryzae]MDN3312098.1 gluconokinase, GntK/IdnK-type [Microbacterium oryzae]